MPRLSPQPAGGATCLEDGMDRAELRRWAEMRKDWGRGMTSAVAQAVLGVLDADSPNAAWVETAASLRDELTALGRAWAEVEAALPEGWVLTLNRHKDGTALAIARSTAYQAGKGEKGVRQRRAVAQGPFGGVAEAGGFTPAGALRALAAGLRDHDAQSMSAAAALPAPPVR